MYNVCIMYNWLLKKDIKNGTFNMYVANKLSKEKEKKA